MKRLHFNYFLISVLLIGILSIGCESETLSTQENNTLDLNSKAIKEQSETSQQSKPVASNPPEYLCSELSGTYTELPIISHGIYINPFYVFDFQDNNSNSNKYASWMTDLQSWLRHDFNDANPSGVNSVDVPLIQFDIYEVDDSGYLTAENANRAYNEFMCQIMDTLGIIYYSDLYEYEFDLFINVSYTACCMIGNEPCCFIPVLQAEGTAYYD